MAASDMRNRRHVQPLLTRSTNAAHPREVVLLYICAVCDGSITSVAAEPPQIQIHPRSQVVASGGVASMECGAVGVPPPPAGVEEERQESQHPAGDCQGDSQRQLCAED
ncbi:hypothetical protein LAZ67_10001956 [Cordylochernes scorpioides]|uniref:Uncharacterized protein n=1 Tax=Cordylochernes scorpioides TaxID=51811 RepID=A0ABY6KZ10_9ARAC|nr:hypothetical protein LAZ67_10001956 [Cordylochernes scorpioides]